MSKIILMIVLLFSITTANSVLLIKKGWQLIGSSIPLNDMSKFKSDSVEQVWHFDAKTQRWLGYSPDADIQARMESNGISKLTSLKNWHGFWIKSKREWGLILEDTPLTHPPSDENSSKDIIELYKGWNLISLPVNSVLSPNIFQGMPVWKYNSKNEWEFFDGNGSNENFPELSHIKNSDGIWVKAPKDTNISVMERVSKLHNFKGVEEVEKYIQEMIKAHNHPYCGIMPMVLYAQPYDMVTMEAVPVPTAMPTTATNGVKNATETNLQESGVDEADILKHDGTNIFYLANNSINVTSFERIANGKSQPITQIPFENGKSILSLYLHNGRLVVLSKNIMVDRVIMKDGENSTAIVPPPIYPKSVVQVDIFDVSNITDIKPLNSYKIDGDIVTSRLVGNTLYLVTKFNPEAEVSYPEVEVTLSENCKEYFENPNYDYDKYADCYGIQHDNGRYYRYDYDNPIVKVTKLLPEMESNTTLSRSLVEPSKLYASSKQNQSPTITTISNIDISSGSYKSSGSFIGSSSTQYASTKAFYLVSDEYPIYYDFNDYKERSTIYKFNLSDEVDYSGVGSVYGHTLNQFALSEYNDILRIATTEGFSWGSTGTRNSVYTLKEQDKILTIEGILTGLGKEGETIQAVRFMGDRGYVVTFRQTDPFYTLDMSNPQEPKKVGELKVNGYSAYLHPVGENMILGFGRDANSEGEIGGIKLELFDISDFANPTSLDTIILDKDTYSELEYNHKALAYRYSDNLFAFPYHKYSNSKDYNYLGVFQVQNNLLKRYNPLSSSDNYSWESSRGLIFDMNGTTYISFFANGDIITEELNKGE